MCLTNTPHNEFVEACADGITETILKLRSYQEGDEDTTQAGTPAPGNRVFIVHGHDDALRQGLVRALERQVIEAVILSEQENEGRTIIEKFQDCSDVAAAVCLFTPDDKAVAEDGSQSFRARQNVVLETGYFIGRLGRDRVIVVRGRDVELPSDLQSLMYTDVDHAIFDVLKELRAMGLPIDLNKL